MAEVDTQGRRRAENQSVAAECEECEECCARPEWSAMSCECERVRRLCAAQWGGLGSATVCGCGLDCSHRIAIGQGHRESSAVLACRECAEQLNPRSLYTRHPCLSTSLFDRLRCCIHLRPLLSPRSAPPPPVRLPALARLCMCSFVFKCVDDAGVGARRRRIRSAGRIPRGCVAWSAQQICWESAIRPAAVPVASNGVGCVWLTQRHDSEVSSAASTNRTLKPSSERADEWSAAERSQKRAKGKDFTRRRLENRVANTLKGWGMKRLTDGV